MFANRTNWTLDPNKISVSLEKKRRQGHDIIDLTESNPTRCGFVLPEEDILKALSHSENLSYQPSPQGLLKAREVLCEAYARKGFRVSPENIFLTASTSEAYSYVFRLIANPGEMVVFPRPSYPLFHFLVDILDVRMGAYDLRYEGQGWKMDFDSLKAQLTPSTKAVACVNPNNPTGHYIKAPETEALNRVCRDSGLALICDEVFWDYGLQEEFRQSLVNNQDCMTYVLGGLSKELGLPQMKLSWIILNGPPRLVEESRKRLEIISDTYLSVGTPVQNALGDWLALKSRLQSQIMERIKNNHALWAAQSGNGLPMLSVEGGWYGIIRLPSGMNEEDWVLMLLEEDDVFVHPGYFFDLAEEPYMIVSFLPTEQKSQIGMERILKRVRDAK